MRLWTKILVAAFCASAAAAQAQELKIFDAHLHYNQEPKPFYELDKVLELFRRNNITGIVATSRPNKGTHELVEAKAPGLWVVPFIRPYRVRADIQTWFNDPAIFELAIRKTGVDASQCLFVDDHAQNIAAAQRLGMQAILFRSPRGRCPSRLRRSSSWEWGLGLPAALSLYADLGKGEHEETSCGHGLVRCAVECVGICRCCGE